jgi:hypothetical protein
MANNNQTRDMGTGLNENRRGRVRNYEDLIYYNTGHITFNVEGAQE